MAYCKECGKESSPGEKFCRYCGSTLFDTQGATFGSSSATSEQDLATFIGKKSDTYLTKFRNFAQQGEDSFAVTWHWPAFFVPFFWMLYRKLYGWAVLAFFLGVIPYIGIMSHIAFGMTAYFLYYSHAKKKILLQHQPPGPSRTTGLAQAGGVNNAALIVAAVLVTVAVIGILAAIAIPQFAAYRQRAFDMKAKHEVQDACKRCIAVLSAHPEKSEIIPDDLLNTGFSPSPDIDLLLLDGRRETFGLSARHEKSTKVFITDHSCSITEEQQQAL